MEPNSYQQITAEQAKAMMDQQEDHILLDVRSQAEFDEGHIEGAIVIPDSEITNRAEADLGYTNIYEFGGIIDWPYDVMT